MNWDRFKYIYIYGNMRIFLKYDNILWKNQSDKIMLSLRELTLKVNTTERYKQSFDVHSCGLMNFTYPFFFKFRENFVSAFLICIFVFLFLLLCYYSNALILFCHLPIFFYSFCYWTRSLYWLFFLSNDY